MIFETLLFVLTPTIQAVPSVGVTISKENCYSKLWFVVRYHQVILREEFEKNRAVCDPKEQRRLLWMGQHELFLKRNPLPPCRFPYSLGVAAGVAYGREIEPPDWVLDYWHPLEKAQYPEYFSRRECRKKEYIKLWEKGIIR